MPAYNDVPLATDRISDSQATIRTNFNSIETAWNINHVAINNAGDPGKHAKVDFINEATHPVVAAGQMLLYNFVDPITTVNELYVKKEGALATAGIPITSSLKATSGWTYLPSGILMKWGSAVTPAAGHFTFTFPVAPGIPVFNNIYSIQLTTTYAGGIDTNKFVALVTWVAPWTTFTGYGCNRTTTAAANLIPFTYLAIGD